MQAAIGRIHYIAASFKNIQTSLYRLWLWR
jgi:hypothetical protein